jgi:hypothetical protein
MSTGGNPGDRANIPVDERKFGNARTGVASRRLSTELVVRRATR